MTVLATTHPTLLDHVKRMDPDGKVASIVELLAQTNEVLADMVWAEANGTTGHVTTVRSGLPSVTWRKLYKGVQPSKSTVVQVTESMGMLEAYAEVDKKLAMLNGNTTEFRLSEDMAFIEAMNQEMAKTLFLGNESTEPEAFTGFAARFNDQSAENARNIITDAATPDSSDNTSIWLIVWGTNTVHGIFPKGMPAGMNVEDLGEVTLEDAAGGKYQGYRTHYEWNAGLSVRDWRYVVRIQFDLEDVVASGATGPVLSELMAKAIRRIPNKSLGRAAFYMNTDALDALEKQCNAKSTLAFGSVMDAQGVEVDAFRKIPIRRVDAITSTETGI